MAEELRPLALGEILDRTVQLYRRNFWLFCGVAAAPAVVVVAGYALELVFGRPSGRQSSTSHFALFSLIDLLLTILSTAYAHAALASAAVDVHLGQPVTFREAVVRTLPRYGLFLRVTALEWLIVGGIACGAALAVTIPVVLLAAIFGRGASAGMVGGVAVVLIFGAVAGIALWLLSLVALAVPVCWVESRRAWDSIKRSSALSKGARGRVAMTYVFIFAIVGISIALRLGTLAAMRANPLIPGYDLAGARLMLTRVFEILYSFLTQTLLSPLAPIAVAVLYIDQRVRKEGFDIDWMMYRAGLHAARAPAAQMDAPAGVAEASMPLPEPATVKEP